MAIHAALLAGVLPIRATLLAGVLPVGPPLLAGVLPVGPPLLACPLAIAATLLSHITAIDSLLLSHFAAIDPLRLAFLASIGPALRPAFDTLVDSLAAVLPSCLAILPPLRDVLATRLVCPLDTLPPLLECGSHPWCRRLARGAPPPLGAVFEQLLDRETPFVGVDASVAVPIGTLADLRCGLRVLDLESLPVLPQSFARTLARGVVTLLMRLPSLLSAVLATLSPNLLPVRSPLLASFLASCLPFLAHLLPRFDALPLRLLRALRDQDRSRCRPCHGHGRNRHDQNVVALVHHSLSPLGQSPRTIPSKGGHLRNRRAPDDTCPTSPEILIARP